MAHAIFIFTAEHWMWCSYGMVGGRSVNVIFISECSLWRGKGGADFQVPGQRTHIFGRGRK